jgi:hypothetical protein
VKEALRKCTLLFSDLVLPTEAEFKTLEDLVAALRPVEILTAKLCKENFNVLQVNIVRFSENQCFGSGIMWLFDPWIPDPKPIFLRA